MGFWDQEQIQRLNLLFLDPSAIFHKQIFPLATMACEPLNRRRHVPPISPSCWNASKNNSSHFNPKFSLICPQKHFFQQLFDLSLWFLATSDQQKCCLWSAVRPPPRWCGSTLFLSTALLMNSYHFDRFLCVISRTLACIFALWNTLWYLPGVTYPLMRLGRILLVPLVMKVELMLAVSSAGFGVICKVGNTFGFFHFTTVQGSTSSPPRRHADLRPHWPARGFSRAFSGYHHLDRNGGHLSTAECQSLPYMMAASVLWSRALCTSDRDNSRCFRLRVSVILTDRFIKKVSSWDIFIQHFKFPYFNDDKFVFTYYFFFTVRLQDN